MLDCTKSQEEKELNVMLRKDEGATTTHKLNTLSNFPIVSVIAKIRRY